MKLQLHSLRGKLQDLEVQMQELAKARDEANERERRVRRGLYRVATGRLDMGEVLKVIFLFYCIFVLHHSHAKVDCNVSHLILFAFLLFHSRR